MKPKSVLFSISIIFFLSCAGYFFYKDMPVLSASQLSNKTPEVIEAYSYAKKYKDVFQKVHCYCGCMLRDANGHRSLFDCFTSLHGENCFECIQEAIFIGQQKTSGIDDRMIIKEIDDKYSKVSQH